MSDNAAAPVVPRRRGSSSSTVRATGLPGQSLLSPQRSSHSSSVVSATIWIHDDTFSSEDILINELILQGSDIQEGGLIEVALVQDAVPTRDFQPPGNDEPASSSGYNNANIDSATFNGSRWLCLARFAQAELKAKQASLQVSVKSTIANAFGFRQGSQVRLRSMGIDENTATHVEFSFRDTYLARSDMWRLVGQELSGKTIYAGQRITFLGSIRLMVKTIHLNGHRTNTAYFSGLTLPIFRSEAARYVIFVQMSREMWDFDSEGNGEILFNRVINGFLPELFKRWSELEVRHLVSIVLFGRQEYRRFDFTPRRDTSAGLAPPEASQFRQSHTQDFYKVVVTDMASAQWTTILDELKKDFRIFLRDVSLHPPPNDSKGLDANVASDATERITGRPSTAIKGNILEAINLAATQFSNDYVDRDLIRTGVSVVIVTAGTGVFEVDRDLLNLTSQNLTNNGMGIDIVCLSKIPLHSVPLLKYQPKTNSQQADIDQLSQASSPYSRPRLHGLSVDHSEAGSPAVSSLTGQNMNPWSRYSASLRTNSLTSWCYGIPHWIDLSYWVPESDRTQLDIFYNEYHPLAGARRKEPFVPRVRMYEVQMMGLMEIGMADISIPWISETQSYKSSRRSRKASTLRDWWASRSLSQSPSLSRHAGKPTLSSYKDRSIPKNDAKGLPETVLKMDNYDETLFKQPLQSSLTSPTKRSREAVSSSPEKATKLPKAITVPKLSTAEPVAEDSKSEAPRSPTSSILSNLLTQKRSPEATRAARSTSYALRGLAPPMRAVASTEINVENAEAQMPKPNLLKTRPAMAVNSDNLRSLSVRGNVPESRTPPTSHSSNLAPTTQRDGERPTTPIRIQQPSDDTGVGKSEATPSRQGTKNTGRKLVGASQTHSSESSSDSEDSLDFDDYGSFAGSIPRSNVPFVRNVNASNPLKGNPNREAFFGRWQHVYPRKPKAATMKWRSLCTPASVPLTTEDFPSKDTLENDYEVSSYTIGLNTIYDQVDIDKPESRDELFREMLSLRFAHGYQLAVGPRINRFQGPNVGDPSFFFNPSAIRTDGHFSFLSMGHTIHKLSLVEKNRIEVSRYVRRLREVQPAFEERIDYDPHIRTILSNQYRVRSMQMKGFTEEYPWEHADRYLAASKKDLDHEVELLRFWRARFVLLPVEPPANAFRQAAADSEENEEEIHLRGIRALTQLWQRTRYISPDERRPGQNRMSALKKKDRNPLMINMETMNPSELVATELDKLIAAEEAGDVQTAQLLPEEEQFERESAPLAKLAAALQGERGIEIKNRRWHLRLHYSCFLGEDFTNWLVQNFRDIDTRDEAIELGNDLMKEGLFEHVNSRHNFKDGNFFYSIKSEYRAPRPELKQSWFPASRKSDRSVPATPLSEQPSRDSQLTASSRSGSNLAPALSGQQSGHSAHSENAKVMNEKATKRLAVSLSKVIRLDVDVRRRSNRPEIVNLHYDRLHNPENCYHLELSWFNVTSKLVDDAIVTWTNQAEKYGLKLVEVPIAEMCKIPDNEPFRAPYKIELIAEPPRRPTNDNNGNGNAYFTATSFTPLQPLNSDVHFYQKQLLKRFNFVLDLEAVSEFPDNVEINYSWGKLDYRFTQFVHRSGVILAQITDEGAILLLANRLYNSRLASTKDATAKFDKKNDNPSLQGLRPPALGPSLNTPQSQMQASGILGLNVQSPTPTPATQPISGLSPSPMHKAVDAIRGTEKISADVLGSKRALGTSGLLTYVTPEQIKDDLESFCRDRERLGDFYRQVSEMVVLPQSHLHGATSEGRSGGSGAGPRRQGTTGSTSSSLLRPVKESELENVEGEGVGGGGGLGLGIPEFRLPESVQVRRQRTT